MSIAQSLQGLSLDAKGLLVILGLFWIASEVLHARRHRACQTRAGDRPLDGEAGPGGPPDPA
jgi:hypothetical protein